jgi:hypothetical protein
MWNKIEDVRPSEGDVVIAYSARDGISYETYFCFDSNGAPMWQRSGRCNMQEVTHWRYKLTPPTTDNMEGANLQANNSAMDAISASIEWAKSHADRPSLSVAFLSGVEWQKQHQ